MRTWLTVGCFAIGLGVMLIYVALHNSGAATPMAAPMPSYSPSFAAIPAPANVAGVQKQYPGPVQATAQADDTTCYPWAPCCPAPANPYPWEPVCTPSPSPSRRPGG